MLNPDIPRNYLTWNARGLTANGSLPARGLTADGSLRSRCLKHLVDADEKSHRGCPRWLGFQFMNR